MRNNRVQLIGYVGKDLASQATEKGDKRVALRVATHYTIKTEGNAERDLENRTDWHNVVAWGGVAEYAERNFVKGSKILVDGFIDYRVYPDKTGHLRYLTLIIAHSLTNLDR